MPIYQNKRNLKKVALPSTEESEVEIHTNLVYGEVEQIYASDKTDLAKAIDVLVALIVRWNLTDENGLSLPITAETIKKFDIGDVSFLLSQTDFADAEKKSILSGGQV